MKNIRIGIPRALLYYSYAHTWKAVLGELGYETITSPETSSGIMKDGTKQSMVTSVFRSRPTSVISGASKTA